MYVVADCQLDENCRSSLQEHAVQLGLDMFALMVIECTSLLRNDLVSGVTAAECDTVPQDEELHAILPCVKVWSDWMICHESLWNPPPLPSDPELG